MAKLNTDEILKSLKGHYARGEMEQAQKVLLANKQQLADPLFHYNLGTVLVKDAKDAAGRYHLELARKKGFIGPELENNLSVVKEKLDLVQLEEGYGYQYQVLETLAGHSFEMLSSFGLFLILLVLTLYKLKKVSKYLVSSCLVLGVLWIGAIWMVQQSYKFGIGLEPLGVREGPSEIFTKSKDLPQGAKFIVGRFSDGWFYIKAPREFSGWVQAKKVGLY